MTPRLNLLLLANSRREPPAPFHPRISLIDLPPRRIKDQLPEILHMWMHTRVIIRRRKLDKLADVRNRAVNAHVLVADDSLGRGLGLVGCCAEFLQDLQRFDTAVDIEGHAGCSEVFVRGAEVMQEAGECPSNWVQGLGLLWELLLRDGHAVEVDAH